jgi:hypothetical protein
MANETTKVAPATKVKAKKEKPPKKKQTKGMKILTVIFSIISVFYVAPVFIVLMNSFKTNAVSIRLHCRMQKLFTDLRAILQVCSSVTSHFGKPFYAHFLLPLAVYF